MVIKLNFNLFVHHLYRNIKVNKREGIILILWRVGLLYKTSSPVGAANVIFKDESYHMGLRPIINYYETLGEINFYICLVLCLSIRDTVYTIRWQLAFKVIDRDLSVRQE